MRSDKIFNEKFAGSLIVSGSIFVVISIIIFVYKATFSFSNPIDSEKFSQFGDFIGGILGPIWALAGVILFYVALKLQSKQLHFQQEEIKENKIQSELSRLTDITYKQIDHFISTYNSIKYKDPDSYDDELTLNTDHVFSLINNHMSKHFDKKLFDEEPEKLDDNAQREEAINMMGGILKYFLNNQEQMFLLFMSLKRSVSVLRMTYIRENINPDDLNELKSIFFKNIGDNFLLTSELSNSAIDSYLSLLRRTGRKISPSDPLDNIRIAIETIIEFKDISYTKERIAQFIKDREMYISF